MLQPDWYPLGERNTLPTTRPVTSLSELPRFDCVALHVSLRPSLSHHQLLWGDFVPHTLFCFMMKEYHHNQELLDVQLRRDRLQ